MRNHVLMLACALAWLSGCHSARVSSTHEGVFAHGAVAADHAAASEAGARILSEGGNAVDAAVATSFALSVVRPYSCGIGGGGFMVVHLEDDARYGRVDVAINYREMAPGAADAGYYERVGDPQASRRGGRAVAVPGTVAGLLHALERYGTMDRAEVMAPAIELARGGFVVDDHYATMARALTRQFEGEPGWDERFSFVWERYLRGGRVREGDRIVVGEQALVLELIAEHGVSAFYEGPVAEAIVGAVHADAGDMTLADLRGYRVEETEPVRREVSGRTVLGMPPPSSGGVTMLQALAVMEAAGVDPWDADDSVETVHVVVESMKHAFADRAEWFGDPAFVDVPVGRLLDEAYVRELAGRIDAGGVGEASSYGSREAPPESGGTSHLCVIDRWGNAVACTETINLRFGSFVAVEEYGFVLNDEMDDFLARRGTVNAYGLRQSERNLPAPGKRPLSSMSPTIVLGGGGGVECIGGASGGPRIITGTMQALMRAMRGEGAGDAVSAPRFHHQWLPDVLQFEEDTPPSSEDRAALEALGHTIGSRGDVGNVQLIRRGASGGWEAACDPRKGGRPAGH